MINNNIYLNIFIYILIEGIVAFIHILFNNLNYSILKLIDSNP